MKSGTHGLDLPFRSISRKFQQHSPMFHSNILASIRLLFRNNIVNWIVPELGYSAPGPDLTLEEHRRIGANLERILEGEKEAARAMSD